MRRGCPPALRARPPPPPPCESRPRPRPPSPARAASGRSRAAAPGLARSPRGMRPPRRRNRHGAGGSRRAGRRPRRRPPGAAEPAAGPAHLPPLGEVHPDPKRAAQGRERRAGVEMDAVCPLEAAEVFLDEAEHVARRREELEIGRLELASAIGGEQRGPRLTPCRPCIAVAPPCELARRLHWRLIIAARRIDAPAAKRRTRRSSFRY